MTKKNEDLDLVKSIQKGLEQAIAYKKGDQTKATSNSVEIDFEKELERSVEQINKFAEGDDSEVEIKKSKKEENE